MEKFTWFFFEKRDILMHILLYNWVCMYLSSRYFMEEGVLCMKKTYVAVIALLLAMVMVSCGVVTAPSTVGSNVVGYTDDGRAIVELELERPPVEADLGSPVESARTLHKLVAEAASDFYEVIFVNTITPNGGSAATEVYRTSWAEGTVARLRVPAGPTLYNNTGTAVNASGTAVVAGDDAYVGYAYIFAGRGSDKTLLGVGTLTQVLKGATPEAGLFITTDSTKVNFDIIALETDIIPTGLPGPITPGTFNISTYSPSAFDTVKSIQIDGNEYPVYQITDAANTIVTFGISNTGPTAIPTGAIVVAGAAEGKSLPFVWPAGAKLTKLDGVDVGKNESASNTAFAATDPLTFPIGLTLKPELGSVGLCLVYFEIPVYLFNNTIPGPGNGKEAVTWYFRGGLQNRGIDLGYDLMSLGGGILISVGDAFEGFDTGLEIGGDY